MAARLQAQQNADSAYRLEVYAGIREHCEKDYVARKAEGQKHFVLTPLREAAMELAGVLHTSEKRIEVDLGTRDRVARWFPEMWQRCLAGRADLWHAQVLTDAAECLADEEDIPRFAELMEDFFARYDDQGSPLMTIDRHQLANAARYRRLKFPQKSSAETFREAHAKRRVWSNLDDNGMGTLGVTCAATDVMACDYRLTLIARKRCENSDDGGTLEQMRADTVRDLILGRLRVGALNSDLESGVRAAGGDPESTFEVVEDVGAFARPVINVTVPISTLMGCSEEPGILSGGDPLPADVVREIATGLGSTWYRLLTDPAGDFQELSSTGYQPTDPLWRSVVARDRTCVWPHCHRPAVACECDHRVQHPEGTTCECNLDSLCHRHHMTKHSEGVEVDREPDGTYVIRTRRGSTLRSSPAEQP
ncbi:MAG: DUF222 domain-containing protein [Nocardioides sp.]